MRNLFAVLFIIPLFFLSAQHRISGTFSPAKEYKWLIAYNLKAGNQVYAADSPIKNGAFTLNLPENTPVGTYRLVYAVPQEEFYFDVLYNGKEDIKLSFTSENGVVFNESTENKLLNTYFREIQEQERKLINFYTSNTRNKKEFRTLIKNYQELQQSYEQRAEGTLALEFIKANRPYIPTKYEPLEAYITHKKETYFNPINFNSSTLQASSFISDKLVNYVFTALPIKQMKQIEIEKILQANIDTAFSKASGLSDAYQFHIANTLWTQTSINNYNTTADYIFNKYLKPSTAAKTNEEIIKNIERHNRLRIGAISPEIKWNDGSSLKTLSELQGAESYILIFWSSTCGHCLRALPDLHKELKNHPKIKVLAVGLEDDERTWKPESAKLSHFEHAIALGKWDSEYAATFNIDATPTYFILDKEKRILAKPENDKELIEFLKENNL